MSQPEKERRIITQQEWFLLCEKWCQEVIPGPFVPLFHTEVEDYQVPDPMPEVPILLFSARLTDKAKKFGKPVREPTFRTVPPGSGSGYKHEYKLVLDGFGRWSVSVWYEDETIPHIESALVFDLDMLRGYLPYQRRRIFERGKPGGKHTGKGRFSFQGLYGQALIENGLTVGLHPDRDFFMGLLQPPMPGQEDLFE